MSQEQGAEPSDEVVDVVTERVLERIEEEQSSLAGDYTKREILEGVAILGTTAAVGGIGTYGAIGRASATHGGGSIGTSTDRVDVFAADASVSSAPTSSNDVARKNEVDGKADSTHASQHGSGGSDTIDAGDLGGSSGTNGQVLQTDGTAASWQDSSSGSGGIWTEDANSPLDASGASSHTYTISGTWDNVLVLVDTENSGISSGNQVRVNGDTGSNYDSVDNSDTETTSASAFDLGANIAGFNGFHLTSFGGNGVGIHTMPAVRATGLLVYGRNSGVTSPPSQFTVRDSGGSNFAVRARVYGVDV